MMNRRDLLRHGSVAAGALGLSAFPFQRTAAAEPTSRKKVLMFTRSQAFEHSVVKRGKKDELSLAEKIVTALGEKNGFDVTCSKDGRDFLAENIAKYDAFHGVVIFDHHNPLQFSREGIADYLDVGMRWAHEALEADPA